MTDPMPVSENVASAPAVLGDARERWLARRRELVTASDAAAILGHDPRRGALEVWAEKIGALESTETPWMRRGRRLEAAVAEEYAEVTSRPVAELDPYDIQIHPEIPWLGCTRDRTTSGCPENPAPAEGGAPLELKAVAQMKAREWRAEPPVHFLLQVQAQMVCTGAQWASLAALIGGLQLAWKDVLRHDRLIAAMLPKLDEFRWRVQRREPPPADGMPGTTAVLQALYADEDGETVELAPEAQALVDEFDRAKAIKGTAAATERAASNKLRALMQNATFARCPDGSLLSLRTVEREAYEVQETTYRQLRHFWPRLNRRT